MIGNAVLAKKYQIQAFKYQMALIILFILRTFLAAPEFSFSIVSLFDFSLEDFTFGNVIGMLGIFLAGVTMLRIYFQPRDKRRLLTSDVFALTRHPMYHGLFIADLQTFFMVELDNIWLWITAIPFWIALCMAGWHQELETLARWGKEAEAYYARTPRFIFEWLWFQRDQRTT